MSNGGPKSKTTEIATRAAQWHEWLMSPGIQDAIRVSSRNAIDPATVARVVSQNLHAEPKLMRCNPSSILNAVVTALSLGLEPDNVRGLAYLVPFRNNEAKTVDCVLIPGYMGYVQLGYRSSQIAAWRVPEIVWDKEEWEYRPSDALPVRHLPLPPERRGKKRIAVYCRVDLTTGGSVWCWLWASEVYAHKERSRAKGGPWKTDEDAMWRKTACRVIRKFVPSSPVLQTMGALDDEAESDRAQSLYEVAATVENAPEPEAVQWEESAGQTDEERIEASLRKEEPENVEVVQNPDGKRNADELPMDSRSAGSRKDMRSPTGADAPSVFQPENDGDRRGP